MTRIISTDLHVLLAPAEWASLAETIPARLSERGYAVESIHADVVDLTCEPDNMLLTQYQQNEGHPPVGEELHRVVVNGRSSLELKVATQAVVAALPAGTYWYGTSHAGPTDPGVGAACAWQHRP